MIFAPGMPDAIITSQIVSEGYEEAITVDEFKTIWSIFKKHKSGVDAMVKHIYFDMDGVLADFERGVRELAGCEVSSQNEDGDEATDDAMWEGIRKAMSLS